MKRSIALMLAAILTFSSLPAAALAAETTDRQALGAVVTEDEAYSEETEAEEADIEETVTEDTGSEDISSEEIASEAIDAEGTESEEAQAGETDAEAADEEETDAEAADEGVTDAEEIAAEDPADAEEEITEDAADADTQEAVYEVIDGEIGVIEEPVIQEVTAEAAEAVNGWKNEDGSWYYYENDKKKTGFFTYGGHRFYLLDSKCVGYKAAEQGRMMTGLRTINGFKYYFAENGTSPGASLGARLTGFRRPASRRSGNIHIISSIPTIPTILRPSRAG